MMMINWQQCCGRSTKGSYLNEHNNLRHFYSNRNVNVCHRHFLRTGTPENIHQKSESKNRRERGETIKINAKQ